MFSIVPYRNNHHVSNHSNENFFNPFSDDFFRAFFGDDFAKGMLGAERPLKVDVQDQGDHYLLETDLPGVSRENVHVDVNNGVLTISAEMNKSDERKDENGNYLYRERRYGKTSRAFNLDGIRDQDITAEFKDGVLRLNLPKLEEISAPTARAIEIR